MTLDEIKARCEEVGDCWIWNQGTDGNGRPQMRYKGNTCYARRVARELADGAEIPKNRKVPCSCGNKLCISPKCSSVATSKQAGKIAAMRGAYSNPDRIMRMVITVRKKSAITDEQIEIARSHPGPATKAAEASGISLSHTKAIRRGAARRDYSNPFTQLIIGK